MTSDGRPTTTAEAPRKRAGTSRKDQGQKSAAKVLVLPQTITVKELSDVTHINPVDVIKQLMRNGIMASMNQLIDYEVAILVTSAFSVKVKLKEGASAGTVSSGGPSNGGDPSTSVTRSPVVTILGHVDHGKTTLLDSIRKSRITAGEVGGITQHIGAYQVRYNDKDITFLDTPGHAAFTAIRARGARVTDVAVLVVAADDGVMPQTVEALNHAKAAGVSILVAINKMDRPDADPDRVKRQLGEQGLVLEEWGGDVITVPISAAQNEGIDELLENILVVSEIADLKAEPDSPASGVVIEARLDKTRGPIATLLVQNGTLRIGDSILAGGAGGRVRAMVNDLHERVKEALPSVPIEMMGFDLLPEAGDPFSVVSDEKTARTAAEGKRRDREVDRAGVRALTLEEVHSKIDLGEVKELNLIVKADVQGSVEAITSVLDGLEESGAKVRILHAGSGTITESDVLLASASKAIVIGFATSTQLGVERLAEREGVDIRQYNIIYRLVEDIEAALKGILEATYREVVQGHAEIRTIFSVGKRNKIAGCMVIDGRITRSAMVRVLRDGQVIHDGTISTLRHFKEDVNEMATGFECGIGLNNYTEFEESDVLETYRRERGRG